MAAIDSLSRKEQRGIAFLMVAPSIAEAARQAGISPRTFRRWLQRTDFKQAMTESAQAAYLATIRRGQAASEQALDTLVEVLADHEVPANTRVAAARAILDLAVRRGELDEVSDRVDKVAGILEESMNASTDQKINDFVDRFQGTSH